MFAKNPKIQIGFDRPVCDEQSDVAQEASVHLDESDLEAASSEIPAETPVTKTAPVKSTSVNEEIADTKTVEAEAVSAMPQLRPEAMPRPHPIEPELRFASPPTLHLEEQAHDESPQTDTKRHRRWIATVFLLAVVLVGTVLGLIFGLRDKSATTAREWWAKDIVENEFDVIYDRDQLVQRHTLALFFYLTHGNQGKWHASAGWLEHHLSECDWYGVTCDESEEVTALSLSSNNLGGFIPWELSRLPHLQNLELPNNYLTGTLPKELGILTDLEELHVFNNNMKGTVPTELGLLSNLRGLWLHDNEFMGQVPSQVCKLRSGRLIGFSADCEGSPPEIQCSCCTGCFP